MTLTVLVPSILSAIITGLVSYLAFVMRTKERLATIEEKLSANEKTLDKLDEIARSVHCLEAKDEVYWSTILPNLADQIHSPTHVRRDTLVDELVQGTIENGEMGELEEYLLKAMTDDCTNGSKRLAASLILGRVRMEMERLADCMLPRRNRVA